MSISDKLREALYKKYKNTGKNETGAGTTDTTNYSKNDTNTTENTQPQMYAAPTSYTTAGLRDFNEKVNRIKSEEEKRKATEEEKRKTAENGTYIEKITTIKEKIPFQYDKNQDGILDAGYERTGQNTDGSYIYGEKQPTETTKKSTIPLQYDVNQDGVLDEGFIAVGQNEDGTLMYRKKTPEDDKWLNPKQDKGTTEEKKTEEKKIEEKKYDPYANPEPPEEQKRKQIEAAAKKKREEGVKAAREKYGTDLEILKQAEEKYGKKSDEYKKVKDMLAEFDPYLNIDYEDIVVSSNLSDSDIKRLEALEELKSNDLKSTYDSYQETLSILNKNNQNLLNLWGVNADGTVDMENKEGYAYKFEEQRKKYEDLLRDSFGRYKSSRLSQTQADMRKALMSRGVSLENLTEEQLIALSGEVGRVAFNDIYEAKTKMEASVNQYNTEIMSELMKLRSSGVISQNEYLMNSQKAKELYEQQISNINKQFAENVFGIEDKSVAKTELDAKEAINMIEAMAKDLGITGTAKGIMQGIVATKGNPIDAYKEIYRQLKDKNSDLYDAVETAETAEKSAIQFEQWIKELEAKAKYISAASDKIPSTVKNLLDGLLLDDGIEGVDVANRYKEYIEGAVSRSDLHNLIAQVKLDIENETDATTKQQLKKFSNILAEKLKGYILPIYLNQ